MRSANNFHCPSCRARSWDHTPPQFLSTGSRSASQSIAPLKNQNLSPATGSVHDCESPLGSLRKSSGGPGEEIPALGRINESNASTSAELSPVTEMYPQLLEYLALPNDRTSHYNPGIQFKNQLGLVMQEIESHRALLREKTNLQEEYLKTQSENLQIKAYLNTGMSREPAIAGPSTLSHSTLKPPAQRSRKSWDSIALDSI